MRQYKFKPVIHYLIIAILTYISTIASLVIVISLVIINFSEPHIEIVYHILGLCVVAASSAYYWEKYDYRYKLSKQYRKFKQKFEDTPIADKYQLHNIDHISLSNEYQRWESCHYEELKNREL